MSGRWPKRDFELCKVVFGAAVSQILYARHAFPPECFQVLPIPQVTSRLFEAIVASGSALQLHDREHLRDQGTTLFLRQATNYGLNRFLGILREDIFPLIENEGLVKFRISYLRTKTWAEDCLAEYYTITFKYELNGSYWLDVRRAGVGRQHVASTDSRLWDLGDYLSRLPSWTEPVHWTLAFHATERPDDPPIGVWKFDRTDFDDANLDLQQRGGYSYARIARFEIMPLSPIESDEVIFETSSDLELGDLTPEKLIMQPAPRNQSQRKKSNEPESSPRNKRTVSAPRRRAMVAAQLTPPLTLASRRNTSKNTATKNGEEVRVTVANTDGVFTQVAGSPRSFNTRKGLVPKRKPKRPLQLFETAASSLPATQIIGESQSLSQRTQANHRQSQESGIGTTGQTQAGFGIPRSPSPDLFALLDGISLSPEAISAIHASPSLALPTLPTSFPNTQDQRRHPISGNNFGSLLRLDPSSSVLGAPDAVGQWEPQASPPSNLLGITLSDDEDSEETTSEEAEAETLPRPPIDGKGDAGISYGFSPHTIARRGSLFYSIPSSSTDED